MGTGATYRAVLSTGRVVDAPISIRSIPGGKRFASTWAQDVGVDGWIHLEERRQGVWVHVATMRVRNSETTKWEAP